MPQEPGIVATWSALGKVDIWDAKALLPALDKSDLRPVSLKPTFTFSGHRDEGFAMDWSPVAKGRFLTGDCANNIHFWDMKDGSWAVDSKAPYTSHTSSVEDLQWSPVEATVFASCSADKTIRIWDTRAPTKKSQLWIAAHKSDVNVISWNRKTPHLLASGADDGMIKVWNLKKFKSDSPAASYKWHKKDITSVEWHPHDETSLAAASSDNSISVWDMALEPDPDVAPQGASLQGAQIPDQLLFLHMGQEHIKELHFHPQIPSLIISTAADGFNFFKPSNMPPTT